MRAPYRLALFALAVAALLTAVGASLSPRVSASEDSDKGIVAGLLSKALSSDTSSVSIGAVDGALSSDVTIRDVVVADSDGPWLKLDQAHLVWSRLALLQRRLQVDDLEIGRLQILRRSVPSGKPQTDGAPILPELPLKVIVKAFRTKSIVLGQPLLGVAAELGASGRATLGPPSEGLDLALEAKRIDSGGDFHLSLGFVPQTSRLSVNAKFEEPPGGLVAHVIGLPAASPIDLKLDGDGPLDSFGAKLQFAAGSDIGADGDLHLQRQGAGRRLTAAMRARVAGLLPPVASDVFAGETDLDASIGLGDDGAVAIDKLALASKTARLDVTGAVDAARRADVALHAKSLPGAPHVGSFALDAEGKGPIDALALTVTSKVESAEFSLGRVAALAAAFHVLPSGPFGDPATRIAIDGEAKASGLSLLDPAYDDAFGPTASLQFSAEARSDGLLHGAKLDWTTERLSASFAGDVSSAHVVGEAKVTAPDLSHFGRLAGLALKGALAGKFEIDAAPRDRAGRAIIGAGVTHFATGKAVIDGFSGGALKLDGVASRLADGGFGFERLRLEGGNGVATIDGQVSQEKAALRAEIDIPEAKALDARISGAARLTADLSGALSSLDGAVLATLKDGRMLGRPTPRLQVSADLLDLTRDAHGEAKLDGLIDAQPATGDLRFAMRPDGGVAIDALTLAVGSARIEGRLALAADRTADGHLAIRAPKLDDLSPLALTKLGGAIDASADLTSGSGKQNAELRAKSAALSVAGAEIAGLDVDLAAQDLFGALSLAGRADFDRIVVSGETITGVKLAARPVAEGSDVELRFTARGLATQAQGRLAAGTPQFTLTKYDASGRGQTLRLLKSAVIGWVGGEVNFSELAVGVGSGRASVAGRVGSSLDLDLAATALPLAALDLAKPGLGLAGTFDAAAKVRGSLQAPEGNWRASVSGLTAPQTRSAGLPPISARASGALSDGRTTLDAAIDLGKGSALRMAGSAPLSSDGALDARITGRLDLALANSVLGASGQRASGAADVDLKLQGRLAEPRAVGYVLVRDGAFSDEISGFKAQSIEATLRADGDVLEVARFSAATPNGGALSASGKVRLDSAAGFPGDLHLTAQRAQLLSNAIVATTADLALDVNGPLARAPKIGGRIEISSMDIQIPGRLPSQSVPLADATHIDPGPTARARLALAARANAQRAAGPPFVAALDLHVSAPSRIFVRGRGVDAELSGDLAISGTTRQPSTTGAFQLRRGTFVILGKTLDFTRGSATFHGGVIPELDMLAQTTTSDATAQIAITGSAAAPTFTFTSQPVFAQDEILSRILFDKPSGSLSPIQALQLANAASSLAGGPDAFEKLRRSLGVDSLDVGSDSSGGATVGVRRSLGNRLSVGVTTGARPEDNGVSMDFDLTRHLRLQGGVNAAGGSQAGVGSQWEY
jgi:translocation and assembly module TamB